ncbi:MAG: hypothetical protein AAF434_01870 [Pseudomonadota bacterium]
MKYAIPLILACTFSLPAIAKDSDGEHAVFGAGSEQCDTYLKARRAGPDASRPFVEWTFAYFSAFNVLVNNTYNIVGEREARDVMNWLDNYCGGSRRSLFVTAVADLTQRLYPQRANISPDSNNKEKWENLLEDAGKS